MFADDSTYSIIKSSKSIMVVSPQRVTISPALTFYTSKQIPPTRPSRAKKRLKSPTNLFLRVYLYPSPILDRVGIFPL